MGGCLRGVLLFCLFIMLAPVLVPFFMVLIIIKTFA